MKVLAAMSGGVDSAVAAARAVEAGHDVTGVHLALNRNAGTLRTGARGCCTIEDLPTPLAPTSATVRPASSASSGAIPPSLRASTSVAG